MDTGTKENTTIKNIIMALFHFGGSGRFFNLEKIHISGAYNVTVP